MDKRRFRFRTNKLHYRDFLDGRTMYSCYKELHINRERLSQVLRGIKTCDYLRAKQLVDRFQPGEPVEKFFEEVDEEI